MKRIFLLLCMFLSMNYLQTNAVIHTNIEAEPIAEEPAPDVHVMEEPIVEGPEPLEIHVFQTMMEVDRLAGQAAVLAGKKRNNMYRIVHDFPLFEIYYIAAQNHVINALTILPMAEDDPTRTNKLLENLVHLGHCKNNLERTIARMETMVSPEEREQALRHRTLLMQQFIDLHETGQAN